MKNNPIVSEIGKYFNPDGQFNEKSFKEVIRKYFKDFTYGSKDGKKWIDEYLNNIVIYLKEKNMGDMAVVLVNSAIVESSLAGIENITLESGNLIYLLKSNEKKNIPKEEEKVGQDKKRKMIFDAALKVFAEKGYYEATIDEIASLSGIGKGSVYRHFKSKKDLLTQLLSEKYEDSMVRISEIFSREGDVLDQIKEMITIWINFIQENHIVYRLIQSETIVQKAGERSMFYDYFISQLPMFKEKILVLNKINKLKTTNFYSVFYGILGFIDGIVHKWYRRGMNYPLTDEIPLIVEVLFNGFVGEKKEGI